MGGYSDEKREDLKQKAQQLLRGKEELPLDLYNQNLEELVENLQVYQIELEMQNEELRRVQGDLALSKEWFQTIFDMAPVGYCLLDWEGTIIQCNQSFTGLFDLHQNEVCGRKMREFVEPDSQDDFYFHLKKVQSQKTRTSAFIGLKNVDKTIHVKLLTALISINHGQENLMLCTANDISREVSYYRRLKESEDQFRSLVNSVDDVIFTIDRELRHSGVHGRWMSKMGFKAEDFLGKRATEIMGEEAGLFHEKYFLKALGGKSEVYEWTSGEGDELQYFQTSLSPIYDENGIVKEIVGVGRNITTPKKDHFELQERVKEQKCLYEISKTLQDYHLPIEDLLQKCVKIIPQGFKFPEKAVAAIITGKKNFFSHDEFDFETGVCLQSKASVDDATYAKVFVKYQNQDANELDQFSRIFLPEEQHLLEIIAGNIVQVLKNRGSKTELDEKNKRLGQLNAEKDRLLSIIAHDLRSPLSSVMGLISLMDERYDSMAPEAIKEYLQVLNQSTQSYYKLLECLLEWAHLQRREKVVKPQSNRVSEIVLEAVSSNQNNITDKEIRVNCEVDADIKFLADKTSMLSVFNNLLSNAIKFSERGGVIIIKAKISGTLVMCSVCDQGIGISKEMQQKLFKLDTEVKRPGTENEPSTGLGLLICKEHLEMNGGKIWVESNLNEGSCFFFSVPVSD